MSSGIPVISTTRARQRPIVPPMRTATTSSPMPTRAACVVAESADVSNAACAVTQPVAMSAIVMPAMP